ncbi:hypothetical protein [Janthinobacterium sp. PC23-8]|uniref:hypothetical protein n=1 Tax=Janthinobacterium sp. PC23-8 TaxID=2012679 RepID=UPI00113FD669|nr:hypothetical protein [Janthinobacterium sp. PC23-8]
MMLKVNKKNSDKLILERKYKFINWGIHVEKVEKYFQLVIIEAKNKGYTENFYISRNDEERQIQIFSGRRPMEFKQTNYNASNDAKKRELSYENGAAIVISQTELGEVAVILYPYSSEKRNRVQQYIIWKVFSDPTHITDSVLKSAVRDFFRYVHVSSAFLSESFVDKSRIRYLEFISKRYSADNGMAKILFAHWIWIFIGSIGSIASIYGIWPNSPKPDSFVPIPESNNLERAILMAKMEGVAFKTPSALDVVAKFYVSPTINFPLNKDSSVFALVSVSPFRPSDSDFTFDAGDCRFLGNVTNFDPASNKAYFSIQTISCTDNSKNAFSLNNTYAQDDFTGFLANLKYPTESNLQVVKEQDGSYSVPVFSNALIKFSNPIKMIKYVGQVNERF